jgi:hypothetical protein
MQLQDGETKNFWLAESYEQDMQLLLFSVEDEVLFGMVVRERGSSK